MRFALEFSAQSARDIELVFDHLFECYVNVGESAAAALKRATQRVLGIRKAAARLTIFPSRGTSRDDMAPGIRSITIDRAMYWFDVDAKAWKMRVRAIFFGGQDHVRHMLVRLLREDG